MYKRIVVLLTLILSVVPLASVNAQSLNEGVDYCLYLPADDCQIILQSESAMSEVSSFAFDMSLYYDISIEGDESGIGDMSFGIDGNGIIALDAVMLEKYQQMALSDPTSYFAEMPAILDAMVTGVDGDVNFTISLPQFMAMLTGGSTEIPLHVLMKDGVYAIDVAALEGALDTEPSGIEWSGIDLNGAFNSLMSDFDFSAFGGDEMAQMNMQAFQEAVTITRLADNSVNGTPVAAFEMIINYGKLLDSTGLGEMLTSTYSNMDMDQETIDSMLSMLADLEIVVNQYIGLEDFRLYRMEMDMAFDMDASMMGGDDSIESMSLAMGIWFEMSNFNVPVDVQLPENITFTSMDEMLFFGI